MTSLPRQLAFRLWHLEGRASANEVRSVISYSESQALGTGAVEGEIN